MSHAGASRAILPFFIVPSVRRRTAWRIAIDGRESTPHLHGQSLRTAEKQPIEGYSREFADNPHRHFLAERSTALDIVPPTALDTEKLGKLLLAPAPIEAHCLSQAAHTF